MSTPLSYRIHMINRVNIVKYAVFIVRYIHQYVTLNEPRFFTTVLLGMNRLLGRTVYSVQ